MDTLLQDLLPLHPRLAFSVSFIPMLDKYSYLVGNASAEFHEAGSTRRGRSRSRYANREASTLPLTNPPRGGLHSFAVSPIAGCSSLADVNPNGTWANQRCRTVTERRLVDSLTVADVLALVPEALPILRFKLDIQGVELDVLRTARRRRCFALVSFTSTSRCAARARAARRCTTASRRATRCSPSCTRAVLTSSCRTLKESRSASTRAATSITTTSAKRTPISDRARSRISRRGCRCPTSSTGAKPFAGRRRRTRSMGSVGVCVCKLRACLSTVIKTPHGSVGAAQSSSALQSRGARSRCRPCPASRRASPSPSLRSRMQTSRGGRCGAHALIAATPLLKVLEVTP